MSTPLNDKEEEKIMESCKCILGIKIEGSEENCLHDRAVLPYLVKRIDVKRLPPRRWTVPSPACDSGSRFRSSVRGLHGNTVFILP